MDQRRRYILPIVMVLVLVPGTVLAQSGSMPGEGQMVRQRILSDINDIKNQLSQINKSLNSLRNEVAAVKRDNQRQRSRINRLERITRRLRKTVKTLEKSSGGSSTTRTSGSSSANTGRSRSTRRPSRIDQPRSIWMQSETVPYKIRRKPLDSETHYLTNDDTTLTKLAHMYYRDASYWRHIYRANRDKLPSPDVVPPNVRLRLPPISELRR